MSEAMLALAERGLAKRRKNEDYQAKVAAGTVINKQIDRRLVAWGEWHLGQRDGAGGGCSSMLAALIQNQGELIRCTAKGVDMPDFVYDTDRAVNQIDGESRAVIVEQYIEVCKTVEERARAVGCGRHTFRRRLIHAQNLVLCYLKAPKRKQKIRESLLKKISTD
ncbi:hypothetical protein SAMN03080615_01649 [Amphritea atlantica]|uniref:Uncharacterized protein n=1 Tax=Amphritea atlantica TaxID=355243 RepID=A0A1H9GFG4_9GAMM|nr:hypothetical protein [Amphritea atlantica]SEQ48783.1 hypothetical protein SAMN03080615_01649 [Amphritea atlantica]